MRGKLHALVTTKTHTLISDWPVEARSIIWCDLDKFPLSLIRPMDSCRSCAKEACVSRD